jgi:hypothetical protein
MADEEPWPSEEALSEARERMSGFVRVDPYAMSLVSRAAEVARRRHGSDVTVSDVLEAMLFRPVQPSLINHVLDGASIAAERGDTGLLDEHVLLAMVLDETCLGSQALANFGVDLVALATHLRQGLDAGERWNKYVRREQQRRDA